MYSCIYSKYSSDVNLILRNKVKMKKRKKSALHTSTLNFQYHQEVSKKGKKHSHLFIRKYFSRFRF